MRLIWNRIEVAIILFVFFISLALGIAFYLYALPIFFSFITEFFAAALGVLLAFSIESDRQKTKETNKKEDLCRDLRTELEEIR